MKEAWIGLILAINQSNPIGSVCLVATVESELVTDALSCISFDLVL